MNEAAGTISSGDCCQIHPEWDSGMDTGQDGRMSYYY